MCIMSIVELIKGDIWGKLKSSLRNFIKDNNICLEIESEADLLFMEYKENNLYKYIDDLREIAFDEIIEYTVNNHTCDISPKLKEIYEKKKYSSRKKDVIFAFFERLSRIIVDIQSKYLEPELKVLIKAQEKTVLQSEKNIIEKMDEIKDIIDSKSFQSVNTKKYEYIGILSVDSSKQDSRICHLLALKEKTLNLSEDFKNYSNSYASLNWEKVINKINQYIAIQLNATKEYALLISANFSFSYAFGKILGIKGSNIAVINRNDIWDKLSYSSTDISFVEKKSIINDSKVLNLVLSIGNININEEIEDIYGNGCESWYSIYYDSFISTNNEFWSLVYNVNSKIAREIRKNNINVINFYFKGNAETIFALGQISNNWCECQIKEYNFLEKEISKRKYFNGIKI